MTHRPTAPTKLQTDERSAGDGDDSIEFAEFACDDAELENAYDGAISESPEAEPPAWFKRRTADVTEPASPTDASHGINTSKPSESEDVTVSQRKRQRRGASDKQRNSKTGDSRLRQTGPQPSHPC